MKKYISVSRESLENKLNKIDNASMKLIEVRRILQSVNDEEKEILKKATDILIKEMELIENTLEDENNEFFNFENLDVE